MRTHGSRKLIVTRRAVWSVVFGLFSAMAQPRSAPMVRPKFEVASIKLCQKDSTPTFVGGGSAPRSPGRLVLNCQTLKGLVQRAYLMFRDGRQNSDPFYLVPIEGGPGWVESERYSIDAKSETPQNQGMLNGPMLQALLEERFRLKVRSETKEIPLLALTIAKSGAKLQATRESSCVPFDPTRPPGPPKPGERVCGLISTDTNGGMVAYGMSIAGLCRQFSGTLGQFVIDRTGLSGAFDMHLDLSPQDLAPHAPVPAASDPSTPPPPDPVSTVRFALRKLGLQLESTKGPGESIVIEHAERPTEN